MDLTTLLNNLRANNNLPPCEPLAAGAFALVDRFGNLIVDASNPASFLTNSLKAHFSLAQIKALSGASGDISAFVLPPRSVVLSTTVKHSEALNGGKATGTLTLDDGANNVADGETVTIGAKVYTFKTALTPTEGEVLIGGSGDASLLNLIRAINHSGTAGTDYQCAYANPDVVAATSVTAHAFVVTAVANGASGNSVATTETCAHLSWGGTTLAGGGSDVSAATARLISAQNNYGTAFDVAQAPGAETFDFYGTPKSELMGGSSLINLHLTVTGTTLDLLTTGALDAWITYLQRPA